MASPKVADLLEKYKILDERANALRLQSAKDEARRESDQRQFDEIMHQLEAQFQTRDLEVIREKVEQEKVAILAELEAFEVALTNAENERAACHAALAAIDEKAAAASRQKAE